MAVALTTRITPAEYLAFDRAASVRHEYLDGEVVAMSGSSRHHDAIACNLLASLHAQLKDRGWPCRPCSSDMRVRVPDSTLYTYSDLSVVCGEALYEDEAVDVLLNPTLLVEVLSPSTAAYDRGRKFEQRDAAAPRMKHPGLSPGCAGRSAPARRSGGRRSTGRRPRRRRHRP